jgi:hypothetical protein
MLNLMPSVCPPQGPVLPSILGLALECIAQRESRVSPSCSLLKLTVALFDPGFSQLRPTRANTSFKALPYFRGNQEFGLLRPTIGALGEACFLGAERFTVSGRRILAVRRSKIA